MYILDKTSIQRPILLIFLSETKLKDPLGSLPYDVEAVDERKLDSATKFEIIQNSGETVFVPSGWHHQVYNLVDTISINHNWFNGCNILTVVLLLREELSRVEVFDLIRADLVPAQQARYG